MKIWYKDYSRFMLKNVGTELRDSKSPKSKGHKRKFRAPAVINVCGVGSGRAFTKSLCPETLSKTSRICDCFKAWWGLMGCGQTTDRN